MKLLIKHENGDEGNAIIKTKGLDDRVLKPGEEIAVDVPVGNTVEITKQTT